MAFFEDDNERPSMIRLLAFLSFFPASYITLNLCTETSLGIFLGVFVGQYAGGRITDVFMKKAKNVPDKSPKKQS